MFSALSDAQWTSFLDFLSLCIKTVILVAVIGNWDELKGKIMPEIDNAFFCSGLAHMYSKTLDHRSMLLLTLQANWKEIFSADQKPNFSCLREQLLRLPTVYMPYAWWTSSDPMDDAFSPSFALHLWVEYLSKNPQVLPVRPLLAPSRKLLAEWTECQRGLHTLATLSDLSMELVSDHAIPAAFEMEEDIEAPVLYPATDFVNYTARPFNPDTFSYDQATNMSIDADGK
ncbi:hypothetical protein BKA70DRAFT_1427625 [Coprinopsis sp. MPI-PUGE-AT-0042]|nr:hypothetical protein BKA70DRAFT_1427625 [Coprinopsis sp. MPI-PUGE-AT-0042]